MHEKSEPAKDIGPNLELEDTREFTGAELLEAGLIIEYFRKHPEFRWPRGFPFGDLVELARAETPQEQESDQPSYDS